ncbi:hypothetical protein [Gabonibacter massiliensis]|uniref:hypothetical protein n=1 Tax=Gabonibacter massiliensis TaxID=1720195 RepID=UPI00073F4605|nr:hypothetical protein [Gabonibacter massiliensis]
MSHSLDEQIKKLKENCDGALPTPGHFERFEQRLELHRKNKRKLRTRWITVSTVAAGTILFFLAHHFYFLQPIDDSQESIAEVAAYYCQQLEKEIEKIEQQASDMDESERQRLLEDIQKMKKESYKLEKEVTLMSHEEHIAQIVQCYNLQIKSLQSIQEILAKVMNPIKY